MQLQPFSQSSSLDKEMWKNKYKYRCNFKTCPKPNWWYSIFSTRNIAHVYYKMLRASFCNIYVNKFKTKYSTKLTYIFMWPFFLFWPWQISKIVQHTPSVSFLNLSFNSLTAPVSIPDGSFRFPVLPRLSVLILIGTHVSWDSVWFLLRHCTTLQELHLSLNEFETVDVSGIKNGMMSAITQRNNSTSSSGSNESINLPPSCNRSDSTDSGHGSSSEEDEGCSFPYLRRLMFDGNHVSDWDEVSKLGMCHRICSWAQTWIFRGHIWLFCCSRNYNMDKNSIAEKCLRTIRVLVVYSDGKKLFTSHVFVTPKQ